jgi:lipopolysaccharide export system protein LptA
MRLSIPALILVCAGAAALAQGTTTPLSDFKHDSNQPVEITSDTLEVDQAAGKAIFTGTVKVAQGELRLAADRLEVFYVQADASAEGAPAQGGIERMAASGNVTLTTGAEAAESERASYVVSTGLVEMEGDVLLTQGPNALSGQKLYIDLNAGTGRMEGRVQTIFTPQSRTPAEAAR